MEAVREIRHIRDNKLEIDLPSSFNNRDVEVIILPSSAERLDSFTPSEFYGMINQPTDSILTECDKLRNEWERST